MACYRTKEERPPLLEGQCAEWSQTGEMVTVVENDGERVRIRDAYGIEHRVLDAKLTWVPCLEAIAAAAGALDEARKEALKSAVGPKKTSGNPKVIKVPRDL